MIAASTLVIVLTIVGFGFLNIYNIRQVYDAQTRDAIAQFRGGLVERGETTTLVFAQALSVPLINNQFDDVKLQVRQTIDQDPALSLIYVLDKNRGVVIHTGQTAAADAGHPPIADPSWAAITKAWGEREDPEASPLVSIEHRSEAGATLLYFAYPIIRDAAATPAAALADDPGTTRFGYVVLGYSLEPIETFAAASRRDRDASSLDTILRTALVGGLFAVFGIILAVFQGLSISKPLKILAARATEISAGDLESRVEVSSRDEIGALGTSFNHMADQLAILLRETAEKATIEKELEVARTIQETLVPGPETVDHGTLRFAGFFQPASHCGGDWWTYQVLADGKLLIVIGDVTGHGVPSAMITATAKAACDVAHNIFAERLEPAALLAIMNQAILQSGGTRFVMTCFASVYDPATRVLTYANAGHNFPYLYRAGQSERGGFTSLMVRGNRLGDLGDSHYEEQRTELAPGDLVIWYTDGIVECEGPSGEEYGEKRFRAAIRELGQDVAAARDQLIAGAYEFYGDVARADDITLVVGRVS
jgi:serine phosphatase RsbU (regulator of sigma subunit)